MSPRRFSSSQRSGSIPVRRTISEDLPWSTWPAVATTRSSFIYASTSWSCVRSARILLAIVTVEVVSVLLVAFERVVHGPREMRDLRHPSRSGSPAGRTDPRSARTPPACPCAVGRRRRVHPEPGSERPTRAGWSPASSHHRPQTRSGRPAPLRAPRRSSRKGHARGLWIVSGASRSIRWTGISPSRPAAMIASTCSSAAIWIRPMRTARAIGWRRNRSKRSARPTRMPA